MPQRLPLYFHQILWLRLIHKTRCSYSHKFVKREGVDTSIQQGVVNGDPDVDAIFRLTRKDKSVDLKVEFDAAAPPVVLPPDTMAPFNSQNTLFLHKALWAFLIPTTVACE